MANSSILGGSSAPSQAAGKDVDALGPSDSSDTGSDVQGEQVMSTAPDNDAEWGALTIDGHADSDAAGTGERASATGNGGGEAADILPDRIVGGLVDDDDASADDDDGEVDA